MRTFQYKVEIIPYITGAAENRDNYVRLLNVWGGEGWDIVKIEFEPGHVYVLLKQEWTQ